MRHLASTGSRLTILMVLVGLSACSGSSGTDAGGGGDDGGGGGVDAGGTGMDGGPRGMDAGAGTDAGGGTDAGADIDAGGGTDAGPDFDAAGCTPTTERTYTECTDGIDNDCDGRMDAADDCSLCPPMSGAETDVTACSNGIDDDCDGWVDCADDSCDGVGACAEEDTDALCSDGLDNDGDHRIDCGERGCAATTPCMAATMTADEADTTLCGNGIDDDHDGRTDCDDSSCDGVGFCGDEDADAVCMDGHDNDGDGRLDCLDPGCADVAYCAGEDTDALCTDGLDNDHDTLVDCRDADCNRRPVCRDRETACANGMDDDGDGLVDCLDDDCMADCASMACSATNWFGTCAGSMETCAAGVCARPLSSFTFPADRVLLVTEIMPNPAGVDDDDAEYVEVTNVSTFTVDVMGLELIDDDATHAPAVVGRPLPLAPGASMLFVQDEDPTLNGGLTGGVLFVNNLGNSGDDAAIRFGGVDLHRVTYPGTGNDLNNVGTDDVSGQSFNLSQAFITGATTTATWCVTPADAANQYEATGPNYGTPGAANLTCP